VIFSYVNDLTIIDLTAYVDMNGTKLSPSDTSAMRQFIESEEEGWLGIG